MQKRLFAPSALPKRSFIFHLNFVAAIRFFPGFGGERRNLIDWLAHIALCSPPPLFPLPPPTSPKWIWRAQGSSLPLDGRAAGRPHIPNSSPSPARRVGFSRAPPPEEEEGRRRRGQKKLLPSSFQLGAYGSFRVLGSFSTISHFFLPFFKVHGREIGASI